MQRAGGAPTVPCPEPVQTGLGGVVPAGRIRTRPSGPRPTPGGVTSGACSSPVPTQPVRQEPISQARKPRPPGSEDARIARAGSPAGVGGPRVRLRATAAAAGPRAVAAENLAQPPSAPAPRPQGEQRSRRESAVPAPDRGRSSGRTSQGAREPAGPESLCTSLQRVEPQGIPEAGQAHRTFKIV